MRVQPRHRWRRPLNVVGPLLALAGVIVGAVLSYVFTLLGESRRERWALSREWRERRLQAYSAYVTDVKRMRSIAHRIAAGIGLSAKAHPLARDDGADLLAEANMARGRSFETLTLMAGRDLVEAARALNRAIWRLEWFARGLLDDADMEGWQIAERDYFRAIGLFHECARQELGVKEDFTPREVEGSPREEYEQERQTRTMQDRPPAIPSAIDAGAPGAGRGVRIQDPFPDHSQGRAGKQFRPELVFLVVGVAGFEPTASSSRTKRATKLRHTPSVLSNTSRRLGSREIGIPS
jgi:hypothetical protein